MRGKLLTVIRRNRQSIPRKCKDLSVLSLASMTQVFSNRVNLMSMKGKRILGTRIHHKYSILQRRVKMIVKREWLRERSGMWLDSNRRPSLSFIILEEDHKGIRVSLQGTIFRQRGMCIQTKKNHKLIKVEAAETNIQRM